MKSGYSCNVHLGSQVVGHRWNWSTSGIAVMWSTQLVLASRECQLRC